ncbi:SDR family NAD(P)-dependent oxidoreductase [Streptomyces mirabilis]|uniref:SDR family NAD(P)-dependent oxidoreductase n=1 Tax=Streptomyces mirabilis TaxID=68239 RepID=UPI0036DF55AD
MAPDLDAVARTFGLDGRVAVVTGAWSGLGAAVAHALASLGARVAVVARRHDRPAALARGIDGLAAPCDLSDLDRIRSVVPTVVEKLGPPEILGNAAGNMFTTERAESACAPSAAARSSTSRPSAAGSTSPASRRPRTRRARPACPA